MEDATRNGRAVTTNLAKRGFAADEPTSPRATLRSCMSESTDGHAIILVVERDPHVRELESYFLEEAGYSVEFAEDGLAALELARELHPDVVITEILVPKLDGLALCRTLKREPATAHVAVLIFSILMADERANEAGADAYLRKPLAEHRLVDTVRELVALRRRAATGKES